MFMDQPLLENAPLPEQKLSKAGRNNEEGSVEAAVFPTKKREYSTCTPLPVSTNHFEKTILNYRA
jgi:hypothetical protein